MGAYATPGLHTYVAAREIEGRFSRAPGHWWSTNRRNLVPRQKFVGENMLVVGGGGGKRVKLEGWVGFLMEGKVARDRLC